MTDSHFVMDGHTVLTGLLGSPVSHSISPLMHNEAFRLLGLNYAYLCFQVEESQLPEAVNGLKTLGARGFNLTMPNKNRMLELTDRLSPAAELIGAVNTVVNDAGILTGYNTDGVGFMRSVRENGCEIRKQSMTVLGAGGAATAICAQAALDGVNKLYIFARPTSRYFSRMRALADKITHTTSCEAILCEQQDHRALMHALSESVLLVNATSVGMAPETKDSILKSPEFFLPHLTVADIIYNPRETLFLQIARSCGCKTFNGLSMLLYQGAEAFRIWTGQEMPVSRIREKYFRD